jgi:type IV pilus assembly protein PilV
MLEYSPRTPRQQGFAMIEVMVAVVIFALALLGLAGLQVLGIKYNQDALLRSQATGYAYEIMDKMRANSAAAKSGEYTLALGATPSGTSVAKKDLIAWVNHLRATLPVGKGCIYTTSDPNAIGAAWEACAAPAAGDFVVVKLQWTRAGTGENATDAFDQASQRVTIVGAL